MHGFSFVIITFITYNIFTGPTAATVDELMGNLMNTSEMYQTQRVTDIREEDEREARERVKREQDEAYEESLIADRAKDEARRAVEQQKQTEEMKVQQAAEQAKVINITPACKRKEFTILYLLFFLETDAP